MSYLDLIEAVSSDDIEWVRDIIVHNTNELLNDPRRLIMEKSLLLPQTVYCRNKNIIEIVVDFFRKYIKLEEEDDLGKYILYAIKYGNLKMTELLLESYKYEDPKWTRAVFDRKNIRIRKEMLKLLISHGLDTSVVDGFGRNPLHEFIEEHAEPDDHDLIDIAKILIDSGVSVNHRDIRGDSTLYYSIATGNLELTSFLIDNGADVHVENYLKRSMLHTTSSFNCNSKIIDLLLAKGVDIDTKDFMDYTPLHLACFYNQDKVITQLLRKGANISAINENGDTPLSLLQIREDNYDASLVAMIKEFSKLSYENHKIHLVDVKLIERKGQGHFEQCTAELERMRRKKFHRSYSYYSGLNMTKIEFKRLAYLTRSKDFVLEVEEFLNTLIYFNKEWEEVLRRATRISNEMLIVESKLYAVFKDVLPDLIIRNISENLTIEDLPSPGARS